MIWTATVIMLIRLWSSEGACAGSRGRHPFQLFCLCLFRDLHASSDGARAILIPVGFPRIPCGLFQRNVISQSLVFLALVHCTWWIQAPICSSCGCVSSSQELVMSGLPDVGKAWESLKSRQDRNRAWHLGIGWICAQAVDQRLHCAIGHHQDLRPIWGLQEHGRHLCASHGESHQWGTDCYSKETKDLILRAIMGHRSQCWFLSLLTESGAYANQNGNSESVRLNLGHAAPIAMYLLGRNHLKQLGSDLGKERERECLTNMGVS